MFNILRSDDMKQALSYNHYEPGYGLVSPKGAMAPSTTDKSLLFNTNALTKDVWKPKVTLQWHEPYRTPLTLQ